MILIRKSKIHTVDNFVHSGETRATRSASCSVIFSLVWYNWFVGTIGAHMTSLFDGSLFEER